MLPLSAVILTGILIVTVEADKAQGPVAGLASSGRRGLSSPAYHRAFALTNKGLLECGCQQHYGHTAPGIAGNIDYTHDIPEFQEIIALHIDNSVGASAEPRPKRIAQTIP